MRFFLFSWVLLGALLALPSLAADTAPKPILEESFDQVAAGKLPRGWDARAGKWAVENGRLRGEATAYLAKILLPTRAVQDVAIEADVTFEQAANDGRWMALAVRNPKGAETPHVQFTNRFNRTRPDGVEIGRYVNLNGKPGWSLLFRGSAPVPGKYGESHHVRFEARGWQARGFVDGQLVAEQILPPEAVTAGRVALTLSAATITFDNVRVTKLPPLEADAAYQKLLAQSRTAPLVFAHRGDSTNAPENTLAAIRQAIALGVDAVEIDVCRSKDGVLMLMHDPTVDRTTNGKGKVSDLTLAELKALDAGAKKDPKFAGERIPTLEEACQTAKGKVRLILDLKIGGYAEEIAAVINKLGMADQIIATCWNRTQAENIRKYIPGAACKLILFQANFPHPFDGAFVAACQQSGIRGLSVVVDCLTPEFIREAHQREIPVYAWTVDDPWQMERMLQLGVDGIYTNNPALLLQVIERVRARAWEMPGARK